MFGLVQDNQLSIMSEALGYDVDVNVKHRNPLREDKHAGCTIKWFNGKLWFIDFGYSPNSICASDMLRLTKGIVRPVYYGEQHSYVKQYKTQTNNTKIDIVTREFNYDDKVYWNSYGVDVDILNSYGCYAVQKLWVNSKDILVDKLCYGIFVEGRVKVYMPKSKTRKWISNVLKEHIGMLRMLSITGDKVIITKSFKDAMTLRCLGYGDVCWLQSESVDMNREAIFSLTKRFKEVIILFDNDIVGKDNSNRLCDKIKSVDSDANVRGVFIADDMAKDISDLTYKHGIVVAKECCISLFNL